MDLRRALLVCALVGAAAAGEAPQAVPAGVAATLFDGTVLRGARAEIAEGRLRLDGRQVDLADCDRIELGGGEAPPASGNRSLWLADGGWMPTSQPAAATQDDAVAVASPFGPLVLPLGALRGWSDGPLPTGSGDVAVLAGGQLPGRVQGITGGKLQLQSDLAPQGGIPLADVKALRLDLPADKPKGLQLVALLDPDRPPLRFLPQLPLRLAVAPDVALALPAGGLHLRVEGGRRVYLGDLTPAKVEEAGAFDVTWPHRVDRNLDGGPIRVAGRRYARGIVVHSKARVAWKLDGGYERLHAVIGIEDLVANVGDCAVTVAGDGKTLWQRDSLRGRDGGVDLDLPLAGVKELAVVVDFGARYDIGDHVALADAYLVKAKR